MKKLQNPKGFILMGTDNNGFRHRYSVEKNEQFKKVFISFMGDLGFEEKEIMQTFLRGYEDGMDEIDRELKISDFEDCCRHYENKKYDVDVFYGNKKIILVVRTKSRRPLLDSMEYKSKWAKHLSIKKIEEVKGKVPLQTIKGIK